MMIRILEMIRIIRDDDDQDQNHVEDHIALADTSFLRNIAKGTTDPRVEFIFPN